jgi:hypothetical protein
MQQLHDPPMTSQADACTYCMHRPKMSQADTIWALLFQFCLGYTFPPATLRLNSSGQTEYCSYLIMLSVVMRNAVAPGTQIKSLNGT